MANISKIKDDSGTIHYIEDSQARSDIDDLKSELSVIIEESQARSDIDDLKSELSVIIEESETNVNLTFDIVGYYYNGDLSNLYTGTADARSCIIPVNEGERYKVSGQSQYQQKLACVYDSNDNILLTIMPELNTQILTDYEFEVPAGGVKMSLSFLHNQPAYAVALKKIGISIKPISADSLEIFETAEPVNILNYEEAITGGYFNPNGTVATNASACRVFVPVHAGTAVCHVNTSMFGAAQGARIPYFDADKNYIGYIQGTIIVPAQAPDEISIVQITIPINAKYIGISNRTVYINRVMVVYGIEMPTEFIPYLAEYKHLSDDLYINSENVKGGTENPLFNKTVAFDGDSICHGISANDGKSGWAGRIGSANEMNWKNYGISGGTVTNNHSHCIMNAIEDIHKYMPTLDYYIFEGGTNDADHLGMAGIGTVTDNDFSGTYDTSTFSGAFETLVYRALTYYPTAKIGYIVAQKMGKTNNANYANRKAYFDRAMEICKKWGIPYIDLWNESPLNPNLTSMYDASLDTHGNIDAKKLYVDGQHLTPTGYDVITSKIQAWMKTL